MSLSQDFIPVKCAKNNEWRTSTKRAHDFIPSASIGSIGHIKTFCPQLLKGNEQIKEDGFKTTYSTNYYQKAIISDPLQNNNKIQQLNPCGRLKEEKLILNPPPIRKIQLSEMKDNYRRNNQKIIIPKMEVTVKSPRRNIKNSSSENEIILNNSGVVKHLDIYVTENRLKYPTYSLKELKQASQDIITFYSAFGTYKGFDGELTPPKRDSPQILLSRAMPRVPNNGMNSSYRESYRDQNRSVLYPDFMAKCSNVATCEHDPADGTYFPESCHIGTGLPVRAIVNVGKTSIKPHDVKSTGNNKN